MKSDGKVRSVMEMQDKLSHRADVEAEAEKLMIDGRYQEATALLSGLKAETPAGANC